MKFSVGHLPVGSLHDFVSLVHCAENLDFDTFFIADHATKQNPYAMLGVAALKTKRINLATGVTNPYSRNPLLTASAISTIDSISNGRAILGIGAGGHGISPFNQERSPPISTLKTSIETIRTLLNSGTVSDPEGPFNLINAKPGSTPAYLHINSMNGQKQSLFLINVAVDEHLIRDIKILLGVLGEIIYQKDSVSSVTAI